MCVDRSYVDIHTDTKSVQQILQLKEKNKCAREIIYVICHTSEVMRSAFSGLQHTVSSTK